METNKIKKNNLKNSLKTIIFNHIFHVFITLSSYLLQISLISELFVCHFSNKNILT